MPDPVTVLEAQLAGATTQPQKVDVLNALAEALYDTDLNRGLEFAHAAHALAQAEGYPAGLAHSLANLCALNLTLGHYASADSQGRQALVLYQELNDRSGQARVLIDLGRTQLILANYTEAMDYLFQAFHIAQELEDRSVESRALYQIAFGYYHIEDFPRAVEVARQALALDRELGHRAGEARDLNGLAVYLYTLGHGDEALACAQESLRLARELGNRLIECHALGTLGETYEQMGEYGQAIHYCSQAGELARQLGAKLPELAAIKTLGAVYRGLRQPDQALAQFHQMLALALAIESKRDIYDAHRALAELYESHGKLAQALAHHKQFHRVWEVVFNEERDRQLQILEVRHRTEIARQQAEIYQLKNVALQREIAERQQAEAALRRSEALHRQAVEAAGAVPYQLDYTTNTYTFMGERILDLTGYPASEMTPQLMGQLQQEVEMFGETVDLSFPEALRRARAGELKVWRTDLRIVTRTGETRWLADASIQVIDEGGKAVGASGILQDITARKRAEATLRESEERYRRAIAAAGAVPYQRDHRTNTFTFVGEGILPMTGYSAAELTPTVLNTLIQEIVMRGEAARLTPGEAIQQIRAGRIREWRTDLRILTRAGETRWLSDASVEIFDEAGQPAGSIGILIDITERKRIEAELRQYQEHLEEQVAERTAALRQANAQLQREIAERQQAEEALRVSQQLLQATIENATAVIDVKDRDGRYLLINRRYEELFHMAREAVIGKTDYDLFPQNYARDYRAFDQRVFASRAALEGEEVVPQADGLHTYLSVKCPLYDAAGEPYAVCSIATDITERKRAAERETRRQVWREKVLVLGQIVAHVADLRACLLTIHESVHRELEFDRAGVFLYDAGENVLHGAYGTTRTGELEDLSVYAQPLADDPVLEGILSDPKGFLFVPDYTVHYGLTPEHEMYGVTEHATVAAWAGDKPVAVISVDNLITGRPMREEQIEALRLFAGYAGLAVENARLYTAVEHELAERARTEEALRQEEERLRYMALATRDAIYDWDVSTSRVWRNEAYQRLYSPNEPVGTDETWWEEHIHPDDRRRVVASIVRAFHEQNPFWSDEYRFRRFDGRYASVLDRGYILYDPSGSPLRMIGAITDITERKRAEEALQARQHFLALLNDITRTALETPNFDAMLQTLADRTGELFHADSVNITLWEAASESTIPIASSAPELRDTFRTLRPEPNAPTLTADVLRAGHVLAVEDVERSAYPRLAARFPVRSVLALPLIAGAQKLGAVLIAFRQPHPFVPDDITRGEQAARLIALAVAKARLLDQLEQRVAERTAELAAANRELEAFSYSVSHDLRAPLRAIDGFSRILLEEHAGHLDPEAHRYLDRLRQGAQRMGQLVDDLLTFSRLGRQPLVKRTVALDDLIRQVVDDLRPDYETRRVEFILGTLPPGEADPALLKQVLVNLINNALKYTRGRDVARIEIGSRPSGDEPVYFVKDNGVGFDMRYADKLFGVFQRLHSTEQFEGTGAGLAIVQRIIHRHGGRVWAEAEPGQGATFFFTL
jgi:PAS domain S-box-containing protein